jgi:glutamate carboxypeptidase
MQALPEKIHVPGAAVSVQGGFHRPPLVRLPGAKKMEFVLRQAARELNLKISFGGSGAASDGNNITALGIPVMDGLGPAGGREHSHDEYMELESLFDRIKLLARGLILLSGSHQS